MPRYSEDSHFDILETCNPDSDVTDKVATCWSGMQNVEVYTYEKSDETGQRKEGLIDKFLVCSAEDEDECPGDDEEPGDAKEEIVRWIYSVGVSRADEEERPVDCRARIYYLRKGTKKHLKARFTAFPTDEPEEIHAEEEEEPPKRPPFSLFGQRPGGTGLPHPLFGRLGLGGQTQQHQQREERLRARERELDDRGRQQVGDVVDLLRDRFAVIDAREARVMEVLVEENGRLHQRNQELVNANNRINEAMSGGRRAQAESHKVAMDAFVEGLRMQSAAGQHRIEVTEQRAAEKVEDAQQRAKEEGRRSLAHALLVPLVPQIPNLIAGVAGIFAAMKAGQPIPNFTPSPVPAAPVPAPTPTGAPTAPSSPPSTGAGVAFPGAGPNPVAAGMPWAGCHLLGNQAHQSFTEEDKKKIREELGEDRYNGLIAWLTSSSDEACIGNLHTFQNLMDEAAYKKLEELCSKEQDELITKMANQILGGAEQIVEAQSAQGGATIDVTATEATT